MEDFFKKFIYNGVGWISLTGEKFKQTIDNFIKEGKLSEKDGKKVIEDFLKNAETKKDELEDQFGNAIDKLIRSFSFASKNEITELETKISELEKLLKKKKTTKASTKKATTTKSKKTPTKKPTTKKAKSSGADSKQKAS